MVFSSVLFLFRFLPIFMICYFLVPRKMKNLVLFLGSLVFYAWGEPVYIFLMLFSTISDYVWGRLIEEYRGKDRSRIFLLCSIGINLFILGFFKYADFLLQTVNTVFGTSIPLLKLPLPIGISFYTFQTMSYVIDVYRGDTKAQRNILQFGVYVTMFPQLIAGPILKYHQVERYLQDRRTDLDAISYGVKRFVTGLAKKVLLANNLGLLWKQVTELGNEQMSILMAWLGIAAFALQIYFDFSGYSDMAIGLGAVLGFHFPENFNYPYVATSVKDFWHRWHISLSTWFKEYVYIPLGGNRKGLPRQLFNILVVWMLTGIWHGAGWNFLFWGLWFALFLILEKLFLGEVLESVPKVFGRIYTLAVVLISWVFFALESPGEILAYLQAMFGMNGIGPVNSLAMFFNYPYVATSVKDFWHRWHISLSTWFKEYVYIPLGGNRKGLPRQLFNILVVWMLTGIWHGAGWNFLFWGLWFALFLILEKLFLGEVLESVPKVFGRIYTLAVVLISWVFFALESPGEILAYLQAMFGMNGIGPVNSLAMFLCNEYLVLLVIALVACLPLGSRLVHALKSSKTGPAMALYRLGEKVIPAVLLLLSVAYIVDASYNPFLYFRF